jgi:hypothetical protein
LPFFLVGVGSLRDQESWEETTFKLRLIQHVNFSQPGCQVKQCQDDNTFQVKGPRDAVQSIKLSFLKEIQVCTPTFYPISSFA